MSGSGIKSRISLHRYGISLLILFSAILSFFPNQAFATDKWTYCYASPIDHQDICYPTLEEAEAGFKALVNFYYANRMRQNYTEILNDGSLRIHYSAPREAPAVVSDHYTFHTSGMDFCSNHPDHMCLSEDELVNNAYQFFVKQYGVANVTNSNVTGPSFLDGPPDYSYAIKSPGAPGGGNIQFGSYQIPRFYNVTLYTSAYKWPMFKGKTAICGTGWPAPDQFSDLEYGSTRPWNDLCGSDAELLIIKAYPLQIESCPANPNPCYPATGDKARFEEDFMFAHRPFTRAYHSVRQFSSPTLAPGWWNPYDERLMFGNSSGYTSLNERGYLESYDLHAPGVFYSKNHVGTVVTQVPNGYSMVEDSGTAKSFDSNGTLTGITNPSDPNASVSLEHDSRGRLSRLVDVQGRAAVFSYSADTASGVLSKVTLADGAEFAYKYDNDGNLIEVDNPGGTARHYVYHESGFAAATQLHYLTGISDENGSRYASFGYDARGRVVLSELMSAPSAPVATTSLIYVNPSAVTVTTDTGATKNYFLNSDPFSKPSQISTQGGGSTTYNYQNGRLVNSSDPLSVTNYAYQDNYISTVTQAVGTPVERQDAFTRDANNRLTSSQAQKMVAGQYVAVSSKAQTYNPRGQVLATTLTDPITGATRTTTTTYCEAADVVAGTCPVVGLLIAVDAPRNDVSDVTTYNYYPSDDASCVAAPTTCSHRKGDLWKVTNAAGQVTQTLRYDGAGRALSRVYGVWCG